MRDSPTILKLMGFFNLQNLGRLSLFSFDYSLTIFIFFDILIEK